MVESSLIGTSSSNIIKPIIYLEIYRIIELFYLAATLSIELYTPFY